MRMYIITEDGRGGWVPVVDGLDSGFSDRVFIAFSENDLSVEVAVGNDWALIETIPEMDPVKFNQLVDIPDGEKILAVERVDKKPGKED